MSSSKGFKATPSFLSDALATRIGVDPNFHDEDRVRTADYISILSQLPATSLNELVNRLVAVDGSNSRSDVDFLVLVDVLVRHPDTVSRLSSSLVDALANTCVERLSDDEAKSTPLVVLAASKLLSWLRRGESLFEAVVRPDVVALGSVYARTEKSFVTLAKRVSARLASTSTTSKRAPETLALIRVLTYVSGRLDAEALPDTYVRPLFDSLEIVAKTVDFIKPYALKLMATLLVRKFNPLDENSSWWNAKLKAFYAKRVLKHLFETKKRLRSLDLLVDVFEGPNKSFNIDLHYASDVLETTKNEVFAASKLVVKSSSDALELEKLARVFFFVDKDALFENVLSSCFANLEKNAWGVETILKHSRRIGIGLRVLGFSVDALNDPLTSAGEGRDARVDKIVETHVLGLLKTCVAVAGHAALYRESAVRAPKYALPFVRGFSAEAAEDFTQKIYEDAYKSENVDVNSVLDAYDAARAAKDARADRYAVPAEIRKESDDAIARLSTKKSAAKQLSTLFPILCDVLDVVARLDASVDPRSDALGALDARTTLTIRRYVDVNMILHPSIDVALRASAVLAVDDRDVLRALLDRVREALGSELAVARPMSTFGYDLFVQSKSFLVQLVQALRARKIGDREDDAEIEDVVCLACGLSCVPDEETASFSLVLLKEVDQISDKWTHITRPTSIALSELVEAVRALDAFRMEGEGGSIDGLKSNSSSGTGRKIRRSISRTNSVGDAHDFAAFLAEASIPSLDGSETAPRQESAGSASSATDAEETTVRVKTAPPEPVEPRSVFFVEREWRLKIASVGRALRESPGSSGIVKRMRSFVFDDLVLKIPQVDPVEARAGRVDVGDGARALFSACGVKTGIAARTGPLALLFATTSSVGDDITKKALARAFEDVFSASFVRDDAVADFERTFRDAAGDVVVEALSSIERSVQFYGEWVEMTADGLRAACTPTATVASASTSEDDDRRGKEGSNSSNENSKQRSMFFSRPKNTPTVPASEEPPTGSFRAKYKLDDSSTALLGLRRTHARSLVGVLERLHGTFKFFDQLDAIAGEYLSAQTDDVLSEGGVGTVLDLSRIVIGVAELVRVRTDDVDSIWPRAKRRATYVGLQRVLGYDPTSTVVLVDASYRRTHASAQSARPEGSAWMRAVVETGRAATQTSARDASLVWSLVDAALSALLDLGPVSLGDFPDNPRDFQWMQAVVCPKTSKSYFCSHFTGVEIGLLLSYSDRVITLLGLRGWAPETTQVLEALTAGVRDCRDLALEPLGDSRSRALVCVLCAAYATHPMEDVRKTSARTLLAALGKDVEAYAVQRCVDWSSSSFDDAFCRSGHKGCEFLASSCDPQSGDELCKSFLELAATVARRRTLFAGVVSCSAPFFEGLEDVGALGAVWGHTVEHGWDVCRMWWVRLLGANRKCCEKTLEKRIVATTTFLLERVEDDAGDSDLALGVLERVTVEIIVKDFPKIAFAALVPLLDAIQAGGIVDAKSRRELLMNHRSVNLDSSLYWRVFRNSRAEALTDYAQVWVDSAGFADRLMPLVEACCADQDFFLKAAPVLFARLLVGWATAALDDSRVEESREPIVARRLLQKLDAIQDVTHANHHQKRAPRPPTAPRRDPLDPVFAFVASVAESCRGSRHKKSIVPKLHDVLLGWAIVLGDSHDRVGAVLAVAAKLRGRISRTALDVRREWVALVAVLRAAQEPTEHFVNHWRSAALALVRDEVCDASSLVSEFLLLLVERWSVAHRSVVDELLRVVSILFTSPRSWTHDPSSTVRYGRETKRRMRRKLRDSAFSQTFAVLSANCVEDEVDDWFRAAAGCLGILSATTTDDDVASTFGRLAHTTALEDAVLSLDELASHEAVTPKKYSLFAKLAERATSADALRPLERTVLKARKACGTFGAPMEVRTAAVALVISFENHPDAKEAFEGKKPSESARRDESTSTDEICRSYLGEASEDVENVADRPSKKSNIVEEEEQDFCSALTSSASFRRRVEASATNAGDAESIAMLKFISDSNVDPKNYKTLSNGPYVLPEPLRSFLTPSTIDETKRKATLELADRLEAEFYR